MIEYDKQKWKMFHFIILIICFNLVTNYLFRIIYLALD